jgi:hypothetical protein
VVVLWADARQPNHKRTNQGKIGANLRIVQTSCPKLKFRWA